MKTLTVFYSLTGHTEKLARAINEAAGGDLLEIKTAKSMPRGFLKYFVAGRQVMKKEQPELAVFDKNPNDYDLVFLGTPVWAGEFVPAVRSFLVRVMLKGKKAALFCAHGGDNPGKAFSDLENELAGNEIIGKIDFKMDGITAAQEAANIESAQKWARDLAKKVSN
ncbi:MAG: flavodoxin [Candidatus Pacebacteria bacterium]|jgi:flavodoxin|nr:flavodoxin [Candidatus Paceibacterota bacterium]